MRSFDTGANTPLVMQYYMGTTDMYPNQNQNTGRYPYTPNGAQINIPPTGNGSCCSSGSPCRLRVHAVHRGTTVLIMLIAATVYAH